MTRKRKRVLYTGQVQGVGFRATALRHSRGRTIQGWVRNLPSGEVELVVEGEETEIDLFLAALGSAMQRRVLETTIHDEPPTSEFDGFEIR